MEISPSVLEFSSPFTQNSTEYLTLQNNSAHPLAFKVKTTAPKVYCVRPNSALIHPGQKVQVSIILQAFSEEPKPDTKCKDKFLVLTTSAIPDTEIDSFSEFWTQLEATSKDLIDSKKIKVNYRIDPNVVSHSHAATAGVNSTSADQSFDDANISQAVQTPSSTLGSEAGTGSLDTPSKASSFKVNGNGVDEQIASSGNRHIAPSSNPPSINPPFVSSIPNNNSSGSTGTSLRSNLDASQQAQLRSAQDKIAALTQELDKQKSTVSTGSSSSVSSPPSTIVRQSNGVPVAIAALLVLVSFIIGWLFF